MRLSFSRSLLLVALGACSSQPASSAPADSGAELVADDGSTAPCTSVGGTCEPIGTGACPILQQNAELCANVILVCCLPPGGEIVTGTDSGDATDSGEATDAGVTNPTPDAGDTNPTPDAGGTKPTPDAGGTKPTPDAGGTNPVPDAGQVTPPDDAGTPTDARSD